MIQWLRIRFQIPRIREQGYPADSRCQRLPHGCDGSQAFGPWAIGSGYRFSTDVIDFRAEGISVDDLKHVGSRTFFLESTEVLMYVLAISKGTLQSESNRFCCHKAQSCVNNDRYLSQVLVLARTFWRRTSTNSLRSCSIKRTLDFCSEYMMSLVNSCCTDSACSELWIECISGNSKDVRGEVLQVVCPCGVPAIDLDPRMSLRGLHAAKLLRVGSKKLKVHRILL